MLQAIKEFRIGRAQIFAGLLLLAFLAQCLWAASARKVSELEYEYISSGYRSAPEQGIRVTSPFTGLMAALPPHVLATLRNAVPAAIKPALGIPRRWVLRLPFVIFGLWLGGALWWVARRLFGDRGGYVALALYCFSPAMVMISSNIGPEVILAWSSFGLIYTAIGVAHTLYAPPRKWIPRILILGAAVGICLSTALWSFTVVLLAFAFMLYLSPGRRGRAFVVLIGASLFGLAILGVVSWIVGSPPLTSSALISPQPTRDLVANLGFILADAYWLPGNPFATVLQEAVLIALLVPALTAYGSWKRTRYFGNTAALIASFAIVLLFTLVPAIRIWNASLGLSFAFLFIGGVAADLLETSWQRPVVLTLAAFFVAKSVLALRLLSGWIHQNLI